MQCILRQKEWRPKCKKKRSKTKFWIQVGEVALKPNTKHKLQRKRLINFTTLQLKPLYNKSIINRGKAANSLEAPVGCVCVSERINIQDT